MRQMNKAVHRVCNGNLRAWADVDILRSGDKAQVWDLCHLGEGLEGVCLVARTRRIGAPFAAVALSSRLNMNIGILPAMLPKTCGTTLSMSLASVSLSSTLDKGD